MNPQSGRNADPTPIFQLTTAYWSSQVLFTANRIGLFALLDGRSADAAQAADMLGLHPRACELLLNACCALGFLEKDGASFRNAPVSSTFLVPGKPAYLGDAVRYGDDMYGVWGHLEQAVRDGRPALRPDSYLGGDPERTRHFVYGMHDRALGPGRALVGLVDLAGRRSLLDVGGGPGTYAALFAERYPGLRGRVLDLPAVAAVGREILNAMPGGDRIESLPGDYHVTPFPAGTDVVLISGVFHRETETCCRGLVARAHDCLEPGGLLLVSDVFTDEGGASPAFAALFGLNMALSADDGGVHSSASAARWMAEAGFESLAVQPFPSPMPHRLVSGRKPMHS